MSFYQRTEPSLQGSDKTFGVFHFYFALMILDVVIRILNDF